MSTVTLSLIAAFFYISFVYSNIPFIEYWRTIWIETAMSTGSHRWLATAFIPENIINDVIDNRAGRTDIIGGEEYLVADETASETTETDETSVPQTEETGPQDILGQASLEVGKPDYAGNTVLINDINEGIVVSEIAGQGYKGKIMLIDDPSRVFVGVTPHRDVEGLRIKDMLNHYDAIAGINASGFADHAGNGNGGQVVGMCASDGSMWGNYIDYYGSVVLSENDRLVVGNISVWDEYDIRDGIQFGPVLIADGEIQVTGSAGYGIQPRTAIGQREDGVIIFLVVDGRDITYSIGCTVGDMAEILARYGAVNAACCDGGSSTVIAYNGEVLNRNCSANPSVGRRLPNAFLVRKKST